MDSNKFYFTSYALKQQDSALNGWYVVYPGNPSSSSKGGAESGVKLSWMLPIVRLYMSMKQVVGREGNSSNASPSGTIKELLDIDNPKLMQYLHYAERCVKEKMKEKKRLQQMQQMQQQQLEQAQEVELEMANNVPSIVDQNMIVIDDNQNPSIPTVPIVPSVANVVNTQHLAAMNPPAAMKKTNAKSTNSGKVNPNMANHASHSATQHQRKQLEIFKEQQRQQQLQQLQAQQQYLAQLRNQQAALFAQMAPSHNPMYPVQPNMNMNMNMNNMSNPAQVYQALLQAIQEQQMRQQQPFLAASNPMLASGKK